MARGASAAFMGAVLAAAASAQPPQASKDLLAKAGAALQNGEADKALGLLQSLPPNDPGQAEAHNLTCRVRLTLEQWSAAATECQQAVRLNQQDSGYHLWLGRALGQKADHATFLTAFSLAKRARSEFEEAVRLNPRNDEALSDLGEFYNDAPGVVGGGTEKAQAIAAQLEKVNAADAHRLRARIAEEQKDYAAAEREFKQAIGAAAHPALGWATLAGFYSRRHRWTDMISAVRSVESAVERDRHAGPALYDGASLLTEADRERELAAKMFEDYLSGSSKTEEAPAFEAHLRLARLKDRLGDSEAANRERAAAQALARDYKPAQDSKRQEPKP